VWLIAGVAALLLVGLGWRFLVDGTLSAPTRDPAWYTWRAQLLMHASPETIIREWGPFGMFSGGYRVTVPLAGALLQRTAGIGSVSFSTILMTGIPVLTALTLGAFAYRHRRDPLLFVLTMLVTGALFLSTPYVGYLDNLMGLYLLALTLPFLSAARTSGGARTAVGLFMALATLTHPTTVAIYVLVLGGLGGLHLLTHRFSFPKALDAYGPMLTAAAVGTAAGLAFWVAGLWGETAPFADAALPPPYPMEVFRTTLGEWIGSLYPLISGPLIVVAIAAIAARTLRREALDDHERMSLLWMLPYLGVLGFLAGLTYPYYRFMNTTLGVMLLIGFGAWVLVRWLGRRGVALGAVGLVVVVGAFGFMFLDGLRGQWAADGPRDRWFHPDYRVPMASVSEYASHLPEDVPIVFVNDYPARRVAWGWSKTFANVGRAGLEGDQAERSTIYFGHLEDFVAGQPSEEGEPTYDRVSRGFFDESQATLERFDEPPAAFLVGAFNVGSSNEALADTDVPIGRLPSGYVAIGPGVVLLQGEGLQPVDAAAMAAAQQVGDAAEAYLADPPGVLDDPLHLLRVIAVLALLLVVPGLIAARYFQLEDGVVRLALVPGISIGLLLAAGSVVVAVTRSPIGTGHAWAAVALAVLAAVGLSLLARRRDAGRAAIVPFVRRSLSLFSNRAFAMLMGTQFLALLGDGIVQASLAKAIAFGGEEGFDIEGRTPEQILSLVLLTYLPYTLFSPFVGVLIDRYDRRRVLVGANLLRGVLIGAIALAGLAVGFDDIGSVLLKGNATAQAGGAIFQLVGGGIALVGTSVAPASAVVLIGAAVYVAGASFATRVIGLEHERTAPSWRDEIRRVVRDVVEGVREVRRRPGAAFGVASFAWLRLQWSFVALSVALIARDILGSESKTPLYIAAATGTAGAILGFVLAQALRRRVAPARLLVVSFGFAALGTLAFAALQGTGGLAVVSFVTALTYFVGKVSVDTIVQRALPDRFRGRGFSLFDIALNAGWIVSGFVLWLGWERVGPRPVLLVTGAVFLAAAGLVVLWSRRLPPSIGDRTDVDAEAPGAAAPAPPN
jgi:MFS family permease